MVETEFGYHIIKVTDIKAPKQRSFEEMKPELEAEVKKQQAQRKFAESADVFSNGVYEQADSLKPVADRLKLEIKTASNVRRTPAPGAAGALANPKFLNALFSPDSVEKKRNTEAVEIAPNTLVAGRVVAVRAGSHAAARRGEGAVRERLVAARAAELAKKEGMEKLAAWKANPASASLPAAVSVSRQQTQKQPRGSGRGGPAGRPGSAAGAGGRGPGRARLCRGEGQQGRAARGAAARGGEAGDASNTASRGHPPRTWPTTSC